MSWHKDEKRLVRSTNLNHPYTAAMKYGWVLLFAIALSGCGAHRDEVSTPAAGSKTAVPEQQSSLAVPARSPSEVTDEKIGLPPYPGAKEVEYSRVRLHTDTGDSFGVAYQTTDSPSQVAAFYKAEGAKVGTLEETPATSELLKSVGVDRTDGTRSAVQAMTDGKGVTVVTVHRFFPAK
ncbi:MAG: hypothetical protein ABI718_10570 [Acidobacteriota bacterium]